MTAMPPGSSVPWAPEDLPVHAEDLGTWNYVVVEEIVDDIAVLRRWPWPVVDPLGRLLWPDGAEHDTNEIAVDLELLRVQLYTSNKIQRQPRCGDTFAVRGETVRDSQDTPPRDLREVLGNHELYDISADAREAAKIAYQSSLGAIRPAGAPDEASIAAVHRELTRRAEHRLRPLRLRRPPVATSAGAGR
jgi:hypothetical protein